MQKEYGKLSKNALVCMYISSLIPAAIAATVVIAVRNMFFADAAWAKLLVTVVLVLCLLGVTVAPYVRFCRYRYAIDEDCIDVKEGLIWIRREIVPIERLHQIAVIRGPVDRILGLGKVSVTTAGGDVIIRFLEVEKAEKIAESLKHRINRIAVEDREQQ